MSVDQANVAARLSKVARLIGTAPAIIEPGSSLNANRYAVTTFNELDSVSDCIARGLMRMGVEPGMRMVMAVPFSGLFIKLTFALLKAGAAPILVDPGMGRKYLVQCLQEARPDGFVAIPRAQAIRTILRSRFQEARFNVTVGKRWFWGGKTLEQLMIMGAEEIAFPTVTENDDAAIIFTTGSTGPPKGVRYYHRTFNHQVDLIRGRYGIRQGSRDLACFPLFGLFDAVMGVTTIIPRMDATKPAEVDPRNILSAVRDWETDQAFGSPALWNTVARWCIAKDEKMPTLRRILSAGAPVPPTVLAMLREIVHPDAEIFTPYGATESLPLASIESREILNDTMHSSRIGKGTCVGSRFESIQWRVIAIQDGPIASIEQAVQVAPGTIGELMVTGPVVTDQYVTRVDQNAIHKVRDGQSVWHRTGDVGYLDAKDRFWFCGRKTHRVVTSDQTLYTIPCEAIFNAHPSVYRSALVRKGPQGSAIPIIVIEPHSDKRPNSPSETAILIEQLKEMAIQFPHTQLIKDFRVYPQKLPVDIRHNSKIFREQLTDWVQEEATHRPT